MANKKTGANKAPIFKCRFCDKEFKRENTLLTHKCIKRDRYNDRESRTFREAYRLFVLFMDTHKLAMKKSEEPVMQFIKSPYFNDFYDFAEYILNNDILNKEQFIKYVYTCGKAVYEWKSTSTYQEWVIKCIRDERPRRGVERSIPALVQWSIDTDNEWTDFFECVSHVTAIHWIETGKISPWMLFTPESTHAQALLSRLSESELQYISKYIDPQYFKILKLRYIDEFNETRNLLKEAGL